MVSRSPDLSPRAPPARVGRPEAESEVVPAAADPSVSPASSFLRWNHLALPLASAEKRALASSRLSEFVMASAMAFASPTNTTSPKGGISGDALMMTTRVEISRSSMIMLSGWTPQGVPVTTTVLAPFNIQGFHGTLTTPRLYLVTVEYDVWPYLTSAFGTAGQRATANGRDNVVGMDLAAFFCGGSRRSSRRRREAG